MLEKYNLLALKSLMKAWAVTKSLIKIKSAWSDYLTEMVIAHLRLCKNIHVTSIFICVVTATLSPLFFTLFVFCNYLVSFSVTTDDILLYRLWCYSYLAMYLKFRLTSFPINLIKDNNFHRLQKYIKTLPLKNMPGKWQLLKVQSNSW